jgi:hypothetical protein
VYEAPRGDIGRDGRQGIQACAKLRRHWAPIPRSSWLWCSSSLPDTRTVTRGSIPAARASGSTIWPWPGPRSPSRAASSRASSHTEEHGLPGRGPPPSLTKKSGPPTTRTPGSFTTSAFCGGSCPLAPFSRCWARFSTCDEQAPAYTSTACGTTTGAVADCGETFSGPATVVTASADRRRPGGTTLPTCRSGCRSSSNP